MKDSDCDPCKLDAGMSIIAEQVCSDELPSIKRKCKKYYNDWLNNKTEASEVVNQIKSILKKPMNIRTVEILEKDMFGKKSKSSKKKTE